ncbi:MAG: two-component sensor histidine kinase, partial [Bacteroidetes bacterium]
MDIYSRKSQWKWYLAAGGVGIIIISLLYTKYLAERLVERENQQAQQFAEAMRQIARTDVDLNCDFTLPGRIIEENTTIPVVVLDETFQIEMYRNIDDRNLDTMSIPNVRQSLDRMVQEGADTILIDIPPDIHKTLIYSHSNLLSMLNWYPFVQLILIAVFIAFGYLGFSASRRAEENQVWLGMAKETAHQLGTPIT